MKVLNLNQSICECMTDKNAHSVDVHAHIHKRAEAAITNAKKIILLFFFASAILHNARAMKTTVSTYDSKNSYASSSLNHLLRV